MSQAFLGQTSLWHTAGRVAKIFLTISFNIVKALVRITHTKERRRRRRRRRRKIYI
jgi:hypothetical protein